jgi:hypothetical protein
MAKKKERAFFGCPRWSEVISDLQTTLVGPHGKIVTAISSGQPVARSMLRKAPLAVRQTLGEMFNIDAYTVDQRAAKP